MKDQHIAERMVEKGYIQKNLIPWKNNDELMETNVNMVMSYDPPYDPEIGINSVQGVMCQVHKL